MATDLDSARDDLAYMRALVSGGAKMQSTIGEAFVWAGGLYGLQCFLHFLQTQGWLASEGLIALLIGFGPTALFIAVLSWIIWKDRASPPGGVGARALGAVFQGAGLANLALALVFAYGAYKAESPGLWLYHPIVVCVFQGVAWFVAFNIMRRSWLGAVAAGWFATAVALGVLVFGDMSAFLLVLAIALLFLMALPGYVIWRGARRA